MRTLISAVLAGVLATLAVASYPANPNEPTPTQNVAVTNTVTTTQAFPRTPFRQRFGYTTDDPTYHVPNDSRLIIETISFQNIKCSGTVRGTSYLEIGPSAVSVMVPLVFERAFDNHNFYSGTISFRVVVEPGEYIYLATVGCDHAVGYVFGYLISVNSPSLAP
jgi:hypothetical protein